ncbi:MAG: hypothetical protein H7039_21320 [Bryobacteraceae bacterium]|nr:hypothetical protein [Bryobacteraceae bacterium]
MDYRLTRTLLSGCLLVLTLFTAHADTTDLIRAKELYFKGVDGDKSCTRESLRLLESLARQSPADPVVLVYLSSNKLLESGRTFALWNKNRLAKEGILGMDKSVALAPDNVEIRFVRALSTYELPSFFQRRKQSEQDLAWLAPRVAPAVEKGELSKDLAAAALYFHGMVRERMGDRQNAIGVWRNAASLSPASKAGQAAASKLR